MNKKRSYSRRFYLSATLLLLLSLPVVAADTSTVKVREEKTVIPTYLAGDPEPNPMFFFGRTSQGAQGPIYPYPFYDRLTGKKVDKTYTMVYIENEYIRIGVLPDIGGRIFEGVDKTNNYNFFYRQHVIKPALIGLIGAWISGGVEWNIPHHHRASTFIPVQYKVEENSDGSKTVWVGELEIRHRMRWAVGYTLRPGKAYLEASVRILNRTPVVNTMLCFANVAVHTNDNYQVIFPPSTQYGTGHAKLTFTKWPIADEMSDPSDARKNVDISWWKNHIAAVSVFGWNVMEDFFAGYDHGKEAGTMSIADHEFVPGQKFFTWGNSPAGDRWSHILTDDDGPYLELMVGAYSDNQPDYSWLQPFEVRSFAMNWYPFRDIGGVKKANLDAAVNLEVKQGVAKLGFYATSAHDAAKVTLRAGQKVLHQETVSINPGKPFVKQIPIPSGIDEHDLVASISDGERVLVSYSPVRLPALPVPRGVTQPPPPQEVKTNEDLYLIGLRAQQFHSPRVDAKPYWDEALRRDPGDTRVNTVLGITAYKKARYEEAGKYLRKAVERLTGNYTDPKDGEAVYYLGLTLKAQHKDDEAFDELSKSTWSFAWRAAGYYELAEIATRRDNLAQAMDMVTRSLQANILNIRALNLKAALLRHLGRQAEAQKVLAAASQDADPLDVRSMAERWLITKDPSAAESLASTMNAHPATAQETAAEYVYAGLWQDGEDVLQLAASSAPDKIHVSPLVYYYLGYFAGKLGNGSKASEYYRLAAAAAPDYVFPFQNVAIEVLRQAIAENPGDARAPYYLGNLLYDRQPEEAARLWKTSIGIDPYFAIAHRNLATAYMHQASGADLDGAIAELEKAVSLDRKYPLHFTELDMLWEQAGAPIEKRLPVFEQNQQVVAQRDDSQNRYIALKVAAGSYDDAIQMMTARQFAIVEGANLNVADQWTNAHMLRGQQRLAARQYQEALADFQAAAAIPSNLPSARSLGFDPGSDRRAREFAYWTGAAYDGMGEHQKALESWKAGTQPIRQASARRQESDPLSAGIQSYYEALCLQKLGEAEKASSLFRDLIATGEKALKQAPPVPEASWPPRQPLPPRVHAATAHYVSGLGYLGLDDKVKAKQELSEAVRLSPDLLGARAALRMMD
jgi:tetratricopeptide (TPR) repeat protein